MPATTDSIKLAIITEYTGDNEPELMTRYQIDLATLYSILRTAYPHIDDDLRLLSSMQHAVKRKNGKLLMPASVATSIASNNGTDKVKIGNTQINRLFRQRTVSRRHADPQSIQSSKASTRLHPRPADVQECAEDVGANSAQLHPKLRKASAAGVPALLTNSLVCVHWCHQVISQVRRFALSMAAALAGFRAEWSQ